MSESNQPTTYVWATMDPKTLRVYKAFNAKRWAVDAAKRHPKRIAVQMACFVTAFEDPNGLMSKQHPPQETNNERASGADRDSDAGGGTSGGEQPVHEADVAGDGQPEGCGQVDRVEGDRADAESEQPQDAAELSTQISLPTEVSTPTEGVETEE